VPAARRLLRDILAGSPRAGDLELIAAELITNAIRHTPSGHDGGTFTITIRSGPGRARIEVEDLGSGQWHALSCDAFAEYGRGLTLVRALADDAGHDAASGRRHRTWAEVTW
jgi:anti-sigma regulatory factor (Ser/Thr protein kinase)